MSQTAADSDPDPATGSDSPSDVDVAAETDTDVETETTAGETPDVEEDLFEEELRIDGICGVY
jgi:mycofactocin precursor